MVATDLRASDDPPGVDNPYWDAVRVLSDSRLNFDGRWSPESFGYDLRTGQRVGPSRDEMVVLYAWAITDPASVAFVAAHAPGGVVEVGAGAGYWAWQLAQRGVDVIAYDDAPPNTHRNRFSQPSPGEMRTLWYPVAQGGTDMAARYPDRALFLCWPPYSTPMAWAALTAYTGSRVIYIGEGEGGCTADDDFHTAIGSGEWTEVAAHQPAQWGGIHDWITVYDRAGVAA
jgi:hypothetical protein